MYFFSPETVKTEKNKQPLTVFLKGVLKVNTVYRSIQQLCSTRSAFAQSLFFNYSQNPWKVSVKESVSSKLQTYSMEFYKQNGLFRRYFREF